MCKFKLYLLFFTGLFLCACNAYQKIPYFQNISRTAPTRESINNYTSLTIQNSDILDVSVSSLNPKAYADSASKSIGYLVDQNGEISLPLIGKHKVAGLTTSVLAAELQTKLVKYLSEPAVNVRVLNFKVAILGDVLKPDTYKVASERITVTEALSMAGDLNISLMLSGLLFPVIFTSLENKPVIYNLELAEDVFFYAI